MTRILLHMPIGILTAWLAQSSAALSLMLCFGFLVYEVVQDLHKRDMAHKDIAGFLWGLAIAGLIISLI